MSVFYIETSLPYIGLWFSVIVSHSVHLQTAAEVPLLGITPYSYSKIIIFRINEVVL